VDGLSLFLFQEEIRRKKRKSMAVKHYSPPWNQYSGTILCLLAPICATMCRKEQTMPETVRLNTQLTRNQYQALLKLQKATGASLKWLVAQAINEYLEKRAKEMR
jgi:hypothetical protein